MGFWKTSGFGIDDETLEVAADIDIGAPRQAVWDLIKPAENAHLLDPEVTRAFRAEGTPTGTGEIQVFIYNSDGEEHVSAVEVIDEVPGEYAITRSFGGTVSALGGYFLTDTATGTRLEKRVKFVPPPNMGWIRRPDMKQCARGINVYLKRVKAFMEGPAEPGAGGMRTWNNL
ncbi:SRPBCC family protein [Citricoccus sp. SGAir0253]|uniref:SRPBCC family protein n=1 Tax=Citricoccus sp. SGAir0253 TaxID=2567881 RepID=UPI0010CD6608|nr:SRPBCC family protein [Citricoccus sp. SGAir0253]QCU78674.1 SRPBCC family protein [Citricoccus sp. SGAir0253]